MATRKAPRKASAKKAAKKAAKKTPKKTAGKKASAKKSGKRVATGERGEITPGRKAPAFTLPSAEGKVSLRSFRGRPVVVYFYPKDDTPGCTLEACDFRDRMERLSAAGAVVLGISPDPVERHVRFAGKHALNFPLLSDEDHTVAEAYGAWKEKSLYGRRFMGIERSTFLIDASGTVRQVWRKVRVKGHADVVLETLKTL